MRSDGRAEPSSQALLHARSSFGRARQPDAREATIRDKKHDNSPEWCVRMPLFPAVSRGEEAVSRDCTVPSACPRRR
jgi:hypothetical protein